TTGHKDRRMFDVMCSPDGANVILAYDVNANQFAYRTYSAGAWSAEQTGPDTTAKVAMVQLRAGPGDADVVGGISNDSHDLWTFRWTGSTFANFAKLATDMGSDDKCERFWVDPGYGAIRIQSWAQVAP